MHTREDNWFFPAPEHTRLHWARSGDGWTRLSIALDGADPDRKTSAIDPAGEQDRLWEPLAQLSDHHQSQGERRESRIHRLASAATVGVAAEENPHEDTRGLAPVPVTAARYRIPGDPVPYMDISRTRDGVLIDIPLEPGVRVYGLGEKMGSLDKRGRTWLMWNSDDPTHSPDKSALYQSLAVAYLWTPDGTTTVFLDSMATIWFDAGEAEPDRLLIEVYDNPVVCYIRSDNTLPRAVEQYTHLTGRIPLPPEWALGFHGCRYSYFPEERVMEVARRFREERIPCDALYLDIHYMDGYRVFTWDRRRFPDPRGMSDALRKEGFRVVTIVDPGVKRDADYPVFTTGMEQGLFLHNPDGTPYTGHVWPGEALFPDFSRHETQEWWARWHRELFECGVDGIWNDMNEPADFSGDPVLRVNFTVPDDLVTREGSFGRVHNGYANGMNAATRLAFQQFRPDERGFVLTRAGAAGIQRHAAIWTGDNHSWWEHLAVTIPMFCNIGLSGAAFVGGDAGGFQLNADGELYSRWIAAAAFTPFFRAHSALDTRDHEPWSFGEEALGVARRFIQLRYRLLPYIYTLFEEATRTGAPVMRPLVWEFPHDRRVPDRGDSFMLGPALLVAPVREPGVQERSVYLPAGVWYDFWTGEAVTEDGRDGSGSVVVAHAPLDRIPLYVRGGSIIPFESPRQHTGEAGDGVLRLLVAPDGAGAAAGTVYADAGEGFRYCDGEYRRARFRWNEGALTVESDQHGSRDYSGWHPRWKRCAPVSLQAGETVSGEYCCCLDGSPDSVLELF